MAPPRIRLRGLRSPNVPSGYILGRSGNGTGEVQLLNLQQLRTMGIASRQDVFNNNTVTIPCVFAYALDSSELPGGQDFVGYAINENWILPQGLPKCYAQVGTAPTANTVFTINVGGVPVGTMTFLSGQTTAVFALAGDTEVAPAERVTVTAPTQINGITGRLEFTIQGEYDVAVGVTSSRAGFVFNRTIANMATATDIVGFTLQEDWTLPANLPNCLAYIPVAPSSTTIFIIRINGTNTANITFAAGANYATFTLASTALVNAGQRLTIVSPTNFNGMSGRLEVTIEGKLV